MQKLAGDRTDESCDPSSPCVVCARVSGKTKRVCWLREMGYRIYVQAEKCFLWRTELEVLNMSAGVETPLRYSAMVTCEESHFLFLIESII